MSSSANHSSLTATVLRLALVIGVVVILYFGQSLLITLTLGALLAMLVNPIDRKLRAWSWPTGLSIAGALLAILLVFGGLFAAVGQQAANFAESWPQTKKTLSKELNQLREEYGLAKFIPEMNANQEEAQGNPSGRNDNGPASSLPISGNRVMGLLSGTFGILGDFFLMLVYVVLFLSQKERLQTFVLRRVPESERDKAQQTMHESRGIVQDYLRGRLILIAILTVLYSIGFLIIGIDYAILIALLVAILSIIPYLGNLIGGVFAMAMAFAGGGGSSAVLGVLITMSIAQALESYILTPLIVGDEVDINPLTTIICVVGMSILWGPVGAIIAIPLFAILRIVFSHVEGLKDYAYLLGQE